MDRCVFLIDTKLSEKPYDEFDVFCVFIDTKKAGGIMDGRFTFEMYALIGQHSTCSDSYLEQDHIIEADPEQFSNLLEEIVQIGYKPEVIQIKSKLC